MATTPAPDHMRAPANLSPDALHQALTELDAKIRTLHNRAHATVAGSTATYHQHAVALEAKRALLVKRLHQAMPPAPNAHAIPQQDHNAWDEIWRGIENLRQDLRDIF
ncbi:hypothetical protein [Hymenobacter rubripertinctus]|uniref:Uncharacterized protein n=1 Tax=Hymenobacter rubripertinctus TaxID=2029981 RepID=A0A418QZD3_9BACT|nr:hypothetical protein [Hymenobacter rubripertinctus]RIY10523.1 hypothetical protein D0T11_10015 [Hymenobacter rubripertinctus]